MIGHVVGGRFRADLTVEPQIQALSIVPEDA